ncbi:MAG: polysaccharide biosynthesis C-terminal domain-containing protein [Calditrichaceae bacterium]
MYPFNRRTRKRLIPVLGNSLYTLITPVLSVFISLLIVRFESVELWGGFVAVLIVMNLVNHILYWGNKEFVLRDISNHPQSISEIWQENIQSRMILFGIAVFLLFFIPVHVIQKWVIVFWMAGAMICQSFEALIVYKRKFVPAFAAEASVTLLLAGGIMLFSDRLTLNLICVLFMGSIILKGMILIFIFAKDIFERFSLRFRIRIFTAAFPFFALGLTGMLQSKMDLYCVTWFLPEKDAGAYQIFINLLIYIQIVANVIIQPFIKNIYRMGNAVLNKLSLQLVLAGTGITLAGIPVIFAVIHWIYQVEIPIMALFWGGIYAIPVYYYITRIYLLFKTGRQNQVVYVNIGGIISNLTLNLIFIPLFGITGAIAAAAMTQWLMLISYLLIEKWQLLKHEMVLREVRL